MDQIMPFQRSQQGTWGYLNLLKSFILYLFITCVCLCAVYTHTRTHRNQKRAVGSLEVES